MAKMFYTLEEAADRLGVTESNIQEMVANGQVRRFMDRNMPMFKRDEIDLMAGADKTPPTKKHPAIGVTSTLVAISQAIDHLVENQDLVLQTPKDKVVKYLAQQLLPLSSGREAGSRDDGWREEIQERLPQLGFMSFAGPKSTIRWLFDYVDIKPEAAALARRMKEAKTDEERIEAAFPNLRFGPGGNAKIVGDDNGG